jgi:hypothetical protein
MNLPRELYDAARIIPLIDKGPRVKGWYDKGKPWSEASKMLNMAGRWGCVMGAGLFTVDIDPGGPESLARFPPLPATLEARTPRGGRHLVYRGTARTGADVLPGVDIRGERGQIAVAPTPGYEWVNDLAIADAPDWLLKLGRVYEREPVTDRPDDLTADTATAIANAKAAPVPESGQVGSILWELAMQTVRGFGCTIEQGTDIIEEHWADRVGPGLLREEHDPRPVEHACTRVEELGGKPWGYLLPKVDASAFDMPVDAFLSLNIAPPRDIVWKLQSGQLGFLYGGANASKTWLALELSRQAITAGKRVLYVVEEGHPAYLQGRFRNLGLRGELFRVAVRKGLSLVRPADIRLLSERVTETRSDLLVIDPLSDCLEGIDESDNGEMHKVRESLKGLVKDTDVCLLVLHHSSKYGSRQGRDDQGMAMENMRGASVLMGAADLMVEVRRMDKEMGVSEVAVTKNRNGSLEVGGRIELTVDRGAVQNVTFLPGLLGQEKTERVRAQVKGEKLDERTAERNADVLAAVRGGATSVKRVKVLCGRGFDSVKTALEALLEDGAVRKEGDLWLPA